MLPNELKANGKIITREIFSSQLTADGRNRGIKQDKRDAELKKIYNNTKKVLKNNVLIPIKSGHNDSSEQLKGYLMDVTLKNKTKPLKNGDEYRYKVIIGKIFVFNDFYKHIYSGRYPHVSVELQGGMYIDPRTFVGEYITAVAYMGTTPPALPFLQKYMAKSFNTKFYSSIDKFLCTNKDYNMDKTTLMEYLAPIFEQFVDNVVSVLSESKEKEEPEEAVEEEMGAKEKMGNDEYSQKKTDLLKREIQLGFKELQLDGKIKDDQKTQFAQIATLQGVEFAKEVFSGMAVSPPTGDVVGKEPAQAADKEALYEDYFKRNPPSPNVAKRLKEVGMIK